MYQVIIKKRYNTGGKLILHLGFFDSKKLAEKVIEDTKPDFSSVEYFSNGCRCKGIQSCLEYIILPIKLKLE